MSRLPKSGYTLRRISQTPRTFANWPAVLSGMVREKVGAGPAELTFVTRDGLRIQCPNRPGARVPLYEIFAEDCYRLSWLLGPLADRKIRVIDIGGHVGTFANRLAQLHSDATITCYEPSATTAEFLRRNVSYNGFGDRVTVVQSALAASDGVAVFDDNGAGSGLNGLAALGHSSGTATEVTTVGFDRAVAEAGGAPDLVKIDCEGGEYDLVLGSDPASWAGVSRVVIEYHPAPGRSWADVRDRFAGIGLAVQHEQTQDGYGCAWLSREPLPPFPA